MAAKRTGSHRSFQSDLDKVDRHRIEPDEYQELPELTDDMLDRAVVRKAGRPRASDPRVQVTIRLPSSVLARWKATGPGWQTRMAEQLANKVPSVD